MRRTSSSLGESVTGLFTKRQLDAATLEDLEDVLVRADLGLETAARVAEAVGRGRYNKEIAPAEVKAILAREVEKVLAPVAKPLLVDRARKPFVIMVVGVNGAGKTTTIGKLAGQYRAQELKWSSPPATPSGRPRLSSFSSGASASGRASSPAPKARTRRDWPSTRWRRPGPAAPTCSFSTPPDGSRTRPA
jgi:fused signal recognition particle receptor